MPMPRPIPTASQGCLSDVVDDSPLGDWLGFVVVVGSEEVVGSEVLSDVVVLKASIHCLGSTPWCRAQQVELFLPQQYPPLAHFVTSVLDF